MLWQTLLVPHLKSCLEHGLYTSSHPPPQGQILRAYEVLPGSTGVTMIGLNQSRGPIICASDWFNQKAPDAILAIETTQKTLLWRTSGKEIRNSPSAGMFCISLQCLQLLQLEAASEPLGTNLEYKSRHLKMNSKNKPTKIWEKPETLIMSLRHT